MQKDERYNLLIDIGGNRPLTHLRRVLTPRGTLVIIGGEEGGPWLGGTDRLLRALLLSPFVKQNLRTFIARSNLEDLQLLKGLIEAGKVTPVIDRAFSLSEASEALRYLEEGRTQGKIVLTIRGIQP